MANQPIILCLSGGGFRATLFHLGVIRALRKATINGERMLASVSDVYAVSGGSILAAHFLANYCDYIGEDNKFDEVEKQIIAFADRDVRNRIFRRWPFYFYMRNPRGHLLQAEYDRFLSGKKINQCYRSDINNIPNFHFLSTSFTDGSLCSFSRNHFERVNTKDNKTEKTVADGFPLAFAVAASSAFPPMFPPILLKPADLGTTGDDIFNSSIELSDGGVYDNYGIDKFFIEQTSVPKEQCLLIVSNAGASFATRPEQTYGGMLSRNIRANDIMMRRVGESTLNKISKMEGVDLFNIQIRDTIEDKNISNIDQKLFRLIRTDLNRFNTKLAKLLINHGERITYSSLSRMNGVVISQVKDDFSKPEETKDITKVLAKAAERRTFPNLIFDFRDAIFLGLWWGIGGVVICLLWASISAGINYKIEQVKRDEAYIKSEATLDAAREAAIKDPADINAIRLALAQAVKTNNELALVLNPNEKSDVINVASSYKNQVSIPKINAEIQVKEILDPIVQPLEKSSYPQKVFLQFAGDLSRAQITALNEALRKAGWLIQGKSGERTSSAAGLSEVRYAGNNREAAQALADALNQTGMGFRNVVIKFNSSIGNNLEVWISR